MSEIVPFNSNPNIELTSEEKKAKAEEIVSKWIKMQKAIKEEITLDEIVLQHMKTQHDSLIEAYHYFYWATIKARESYENIDLILQNNFNYLHYELSPNPDLGLKDGFPFCMNLMFFFRENFEYTLELISLIEEQYEKKKKKKKNFIDEIEENEKLSEEQVKEKENEEKKEKEEENKKIDSIINLFCHQMYNNILIPNPEQEELMILIFVLLAKRIAKLEMSSVKGFLLEETFLGKFLKSFTRKPELKIFLSKALNNIINKIDCNEERCLHLNPLFIKKRIIEKGRKADNIVANISMTKIDRLLKENIPMTSLHFEDEETKKKKENEDKKEKTFYHFEQNKDQLLITLKQKEENENVKDVLLSHLNGLNKNPNLYASNMLYSYFFRCDKYLKETAEEYKAGYKFYINAIDEILGQFFDKITTIPYTIRCICKIIHTLISKKYPNLKNYQKNAFIGEFIFGKCLLPILESSTTNDVLSSIYLKSKTNYVLKNIAKIIKHIYRGELFNDEKDPGFTYFNNYILQVIPSINNFFKELIKVDIPNVLNSYLQKYIDTPSLSAFKLRKLEKMNQNKENKKEPIVYDYFKEYPEEYIDIKCVCFCIDDILFLHDILSKNLERFKGFYKYIFFSKTVQKIGDTLSDIKGALKKPNEFDIDEVKQEIEKKKIDKNSSSEKKQETIGYNKYGPFKKPTKFFYVVFKEYENENKKLKKINVNCPLVNTNDEVKILDQMKFCLKKILGSLITINLKDHPRLCNAVTNKDFFYSLEQTLEDLEGDQEPSSDKVPIKWYAQFLCDCSKKDIVNKNNDDFNTIYNILQKQEEEHLKNLRIENTDVLTKRGMNIRCAEKIIEKVNKEFFRMLKVKGYKKMQKFSEITNIEACITFKTREELSKGENKGAILIEDGQKCIHQKMKTLHEVTADRNTETLKELYIKRSEHHAQKIKNLIDKIKEYNAKEKILSEDILKGSKDNFIVKMNSTMDSYRILLKQRIDKSEIFFEDQPEEKTVTLNQIQDYILKQLYSETFPSENDFNINESKEEEQKTPQKDKKFYQKLEQLKDIKPEELQIKLELPEKQINESVDILKKIEEANSVFEKIKYVNWAYNLISILLHFISGKDGPGGADDISPVFQYIVIKAMPKRLISNIAYIKSTLNLEGQVSFLVAQLEYSIEFFTNFKRDNLIKAI